MKWGKTRKVYYFLFNTFPDWPYPKGKCKLCLTVNVSGFLLLDRRGQCIILCHYFRPSLSLTLFDPALIPSANASLAASHLLVERPLEQRVAQASHHHKEQGKVAAAAGPVAVQVDTQTHLVAVLTGVERCRVEEAEGGEGLTK